MGAETSKAWMSGAEGGNTAKTSSGAAKNGSGDTAIKNQLKDQAFQVIAGQMQKQTVANAPKDSSGNTLLGSKVHKNCAANLANMLAFNTAAIVKSSTAGSAAKAVKGNQPIAISFPAWSVVIGDKPVAADFNYYVVPNGFCYVNQCLESYLTSGTSDEGAGLGKLISSTNMENPGSGTCGLANAVCASLAAYRNENITPSRNSSWRDCHPQRVRYEDARVRAEHCPGHRCPRGCPRRGGAQRVHVRDLGRHESVLHHRGQGCDLLRRQGVARARSDGGQLHRGARGLSSAFTPGGGVTSVFVALAPRAHWRSARAGFSARRRPAPPCS